MPRKMFAEILSLITWPGAPLRNSAGPGWQANHLNIPTNIDLRFGARWILKSWDHSSLILISPIRFRLTGLYRRLVNKRLIVNYHFDRSSTDAHETPMIRPKDRRHSLL